MKERTPWLKVYEPAEEPSPLSPCLHGEIVIPPSEALPVPMLTPTLSYADWLALGNQPLPDMTPDTTPAPMTLEETKENIMRLLTDGTYSFHPEEVRALSSCLHHLGTAKRDSEPTSTVPCCLCGGKVIEFFIPNEAWNRIIRKGGPETDKEYLCWNCFEASMSTEKEVDS